MGRKNNRTFGFTLIELLVVVSIVGLLAVLAIVYFRGDVFRANDARRKSNLARIRVALEEYEKDHNCYPSVESMSLCGTDPSIAIHPYLNNVPCDPVTHAPYPYVNDGSLTCSGWYHIFALLQDTGDSSVIPGIGPNGSYNYYRYSPNAPVYTPLPGSTSPPASSTPAPTGNSQIVRYGCVGGSCVQLVDPVCQPTFDNDTCNNNVCPTDPNDALWCH